MKVISTTLLAAILACGASTERGPIAELDGDFLLVGNKRDADISVIDIASGNTIKRIGTGAGPHEIAVTTDRRWAVVANYGEQAPGNTLTIIDLQSLQAVGSIDLGNYTRPHGVAFMPGDRLIAVTSETTQSVVIVDFIARTVRYAIPTNAQVSHMLVVSPDGKRIYTANIGSGTATALDVEARNIVQTLPAGGQAEGIGLAPDGRTLWVGSNQEGTVKIFDTSTWAEVGRLNTPGVPIRVYFDPSARFVTVSSFQSGAFHIFDFATRALLRTVQVGDSPIGTAFAPDGNTAFVARSGANAVSVVNMQTGAITRTITTGNTPDAIAYVKR